jgi:hypothetical protein
MERLGARATPSVMFLLRRFELMAGFGEEGTREFIGAVDNGSH